jgi:ferredoxin, 2Fe-2S
MRGRLTTTGTRSECHACFITVVTGTESMSPMLPYEAGGVAQAASSGRLSGNAVRLACQARVRGDVTVFKRGVRPVRAAD